MNPGGEGRRALLATALGAALGLIAAVFARRGARAGNLESKPKAGRAWRGRSAT
jgi:hypothetical protein